MTVSKNILVVDDDDQICGMLCDFLESEGYHVTAVDTGEKMRQAIAVDDPDLILLDLTLPDTDGLNLAREIRSRKTTPIIMLTGKSDPVDKIVGLEVGADDYVTKPFNLRELLARVRSVMRRVDAANTSEFASGSQNAVACFEGWKLDLNAHELTSPENEKVHLTNHEFQLLSIFVKSINQVMARDKLMDQITGRERDPSDRSIDILVRKLRMKIEKDPSQPALIKSIRSIGYKFTAKVEFQ